MARLEAQSKLLYYPTPESIVKQIATWFSPVGDRFVRLADPCCGKGLALYELKNTLAPHGETWGVELSYERARQAQALLDKVLKVSFYDVVAPGKWSDRSVSLMFNNPPYDWSHYEEIVNGIKRRIRHEALFIDYATRKIFPGGHHVIIIPKKMLGNKEYLGSPEKVARHLLGWYEDIKIYRFPDGEYEKFSQVVVFALNKRDKYQAPKKEAMDEIIVLANPEVDIPIICDGTGEYKLPTAPTQGVKLTYTPVNPKDIYRIVKATNPIETPDYYKNTYVRPNGASFNPAVPLSLGHIAMMVTGQETGNIVLEDENGQAMIMKGMSKKAVDVIAHDKTDSNGEYIGTAVTEKEKYISTLSIVHANGEIKLLNDQKTVGDFMLKYADVIADIILKKNKPTYEWNPSDAEWQKVSKIALGLPPLPGRKERGLFPVQKHFAIATFKTAMKHGNSIVNAEMGFGKTATSVGVMELLDEWPNIIMCPGHMVWKWFRDVALASDPKDPIVGRVITRPTLDTKLTPDGELIDPPKWLGIRKLIQDMGGEIISTYRNQVSPIHEGDPGNRRILAIKCSDENRVRIANYLKTLAIKPKDKKGIDVHIQFTNTGIEAEYPDRDEYTLFDFVNDYKAGILKTKAVAIVGFDPAKYDAGLEGDPAVVYKHARVKDENYEDVLVKVPTCPICGEILYELKKTLPNICPRCKSPLFNFTRWRRTGLARLVQKKFTHFFKIYIADEIHKTKSGDTDIGVADQRILSSTKYNIALTGTLFGGIASSLFYLLYRRNPEVRRLYRYEDVNRWVDHYGLWEKSWTQNKKYVSGYGLSTNIKRFGYRQKELPGISPAVIKYLLPLTLFGNITDLGYELPPMYEDVITLPMTQNQSLQYDALDHELFQAALQLVKAGDMGLLSVWFNTCRFRPASAFRDEVIDYKGKRGGSYYKDIPSVISSKEPWLPKEIKLAEIVRENMARGRKVLVFVEQTGTRDIRDRLCDAITKLTPNGSMSLVQVESLSASDMSPARRETWINSRAPFMDALLVNPKLVETGLDLVMFSTLVFYEITTSLYVLWQAMRRVWRLGQDKPVAVKFLAYSDTIEEKILVRMGQKMKRAQLLYGKEASGVLIETDGEDDIQREMIRAALEGKAPKDVGEAITSIFGNGSEKIMQITEDPRGSPIAISPVVVQVTDIPSGEQQMLLFPNILVPINKKRKPKSLGTIGQISFWGS